MKPKFIPLMLLLTVCLVLLSSCSLFGGTSDKKVIEYLKAIGPDFEKSKENLKVFDEKFSEDLDGITKALDLVKKSKSESQARMDNVSKQAVPDKPEALVAFHNSLAQYYKGVIQLMNDYEQILTYSQVLFKSFTPIEKAANTDLGKAPSIEEVKVLVKGLKTSINESIATIKSSTPPQYMADSHANYISILTKYGSATDDFIYALQLMDPLRINATTYRYDLLSNRLKSLSNEMDKDIEKEQSKMNELGNKLKKNQDELYRQLLLWQGEYKIGN